MSDTLPKGSILTLALTLAMSLVLRLTLTRNLTNPRSKSITLVRRVRRVVESLLGSRGCLEMGSDSWRRVLAGVMMVIALVTSITIRALVLLLLLVLVVKVGEVCRRFNRACLLSTIRPPSILLTTMVAWMLPILAPTPTVIAIVLCSVARAIAKIAATMTAMAAERSRGYPPSLLTIHRAKGFFLILAWGRLFGTVELLGMSPVGRGL